MITLGRLEKKIDGITERLNRIENSIRTWPDCVNETYAKLQGKIMALDAGMKGIGDGLVDELRNIRIEIASTKIRYLNIETLIRGYAPKRKRRRASK